MADTMIEPMPPFHTHAEPRDLADCLMQMRRGRRTTRVLLMNDKPHDLIAMKLRADRPQDDYDISEIVKAHTIDKDIIRQHVTAEQFDRFIAIRNRVKRG